MENAFFNNGLYYKLVPLEGDYSTIEISGIRMHVIPVKENIGKKADLLEPLEGKKVLDVCTGLGYSAIEFAKRKANVISIENDENVLSIAKENEFSKNLFNNERIGIIVGDASEVLKDFGKNEFDRILSDPPRFSRAGELYSTSFYKELFRVMKPNGLLFHYTGRPFSKYRIKKTVGNIANRLEEARFRNVEWNEECVGYLARK